MRRLFQVISVTFATYIASVIGLQFGASKCVEEYGCLLGFVVVALYPTVFSLAFIIFLTFKKPKLLPILVILVFAASFFFAKFEREINNWIDDVSLNFRLIGKKNVQQTRMVKDEKLGYEMYLPEDWSLKESDNLQASFIISRRDFVDQYSYLISDKSGICRLELVTYKDLSLYLKDAYKKESNLTANEQGQKVFVVKAENNVRYDFPGFNDRGVNNLFLFNYFYGRTESWKTHCEAPFIKIINSFKIISG